MPARSRGAAIDGLNHRRRHEVQLGVGGEQCFGMKITCHPNALSTIRQSMGAANLGTDLKAIDDAQQEPVLLGHPAKLSSECDNR